jgi:hypothetical protein
MVSPQIGLLRCIEQLDAADGTCRIIAHSERRGENANSHRKNDDHCIVDVVNPDLARDREEQRPKSTMAGIPSRTLPRITKATMVTARNIGTPPGWHD